MRRHISLGQLAGFFFANLCGMVIVLLSIQFYQDVAPVFTEGDSFMKKDYIIVSKKVSTLGLSEAQPMYSGGCGLKPRWGTCVG